MQATGQGVSGERNMVRLQLQGYLFSLIRGKVKSV